MIDTFQFKNSRQRTCVARNTRNAKENEHPLPAIRTKSNEPVGLSGTLSAANGP